MSGIHAHTLATMTDAEYASWYAKQPRAIDLDDAASLPRAWCKHCRKYHSLGRCATIDNPYLPTEKIYICPQCQHGMVLGRAAWDRLQELARCR